MSEHETLLDEAEPLCARALYEARRKLLEAAGVLMLATEGSYPHKDHDDEVTDNANG